MKVRDAMHAQATWCAPDKALADIAKVMRDEDIGAVPIGENDRLVGMVTDRDIALNGVGRGLDPVKAKASDVMSKGVIYCTENQDLEDAVRLMEDRRIRRLPVINDQKRLVGMLSLGDVSHAGSRELAGELLQSVTAHHGG